MQLHTISKMKLYRIVKTRLSYNSKMKQVATDPRQNWIHYKNHILKGSESCESKEWMD